LLGSPLHDAQRAMRTRLQAGQTRRETTPRGRHPNRARQATKTSRGRHVGRARGASSSRTERRNGSATRRTQWIDQRPGGQRRRPVTPDGRPGGTKKRQRRGCRRSGTERRTKRAVESAQGGSRQDDGRGCARHATVETAVGKGRARTIRAVWAGLRGERGKEWELSGGGSGGVVWCGVVRMWNGGGGCGEEEETTVVGQPRLYTSRMGVPASTFKFRAKCASRGNFAAVPPLRRSTWQVPLSPLPSSLSDRWRGLGWARPGHLRILYVCLVSIGRTGLREVRRRYRRRYNPISQTQTSRDRSGSWTPKPPCIPTSMDFSSSGLSVLSCLGADFWRRDCLGA
jgi:hypothetical protein